MGESAEKNADVPSAGAERVQPDVLRVRTAPQTGVEGVDGGHLVGREREVEDVEVLRDAVYSSGASWCNKYRSRYSSPNLSRLVSKARSAES